MIATEPELLNFFIFNPKYGQSEGQEYKKILFYYPHKTDKDIQLKNAGLCEALIKFTESFNPDKPCQNFHTQKAKQFFYEAEKDFWLVMTISIPTGKWKNGECSNGDNSDLIKENVFQAVLRKSYRAYKLFFGTFASVIELTSPDDSLKLLKEKLENFYDNYLLDLKLEKCDILDVFQGISFLPLGKEPFLHIQSFINMVETKFKLVKFSTFLYNDQLIWSGINLDDMQIIYSYLIYTLFPPYVDGDLQCGSLASENKSCLYKYGTFLMKCSTLENKSGVQKVPKVFLTSNSESSERFHLLVYKLSGATLCLFISENDSLTTDLLISLDSYLGPYVTSLVPEMSTQFQSSKLVRAPNDSGPKILYFNKLNFAQKSTMHTNISKGNLSKTVSNELLRMISDLNAEKSGVHACGEVMYLTLNDCWIVGRYSNSREFYIIFSQKKCGLDDIAEDVKKLCNEHLHGIFFTE